MIRAALLLAAIVWASVSTPAHATEHYVVQWTKTRQCEVLTRMPLFGNNWLTPLAVIRATLNSRYEADRELERLRRRRECPQSPETLRNDLRRTENQQSKNRP